MSHPEPELKYESDQDRIERLEQQVAALQQVTLPRCVRKTSEMHVGGWPLYQIAMGPDLEQGERRGHARAMIAIGGLALGGVSLGGCSVGLCAALGGLAVGSVACGGVALGLLAFGGVAVGAVAVGGVAIGHYACGGVAVGSHVISEQQRDPEAVRFFQQWFPALEALVRKR
jgi:hypothetical protein